MLKSIVLTYHIAFFQKNNDSYNPLQEEYKQIFLTDYLHSSSRKLGKIEKTGEAGEHRNVKYCLYPSQKSCGTVSLLEAQKPTFLWFCLLWF